MIKDILLIAAVCFFMFWLAPTMASWFAPETEASEPEYNRGCIASAYQATRYGHDLETNLAACK